MAPGELIDADFCIKENLMVDSCDYYGLAENGGLVAIGALALHNEQTAELAFLAVRPERRGEGHGGRLLSQLETVARAAGATVMQVDPVDYENDDASNFFGQHGYEPSIYAGDESLYKHLSD